MATFNPYVCLMDVFHILNLAADQSRQNGSSPSLLFCDSVDRHSQTTMVTGTKANVHQDCTDCFRFIKVLKMVNTTISFNVIALYYVSRLSLNVSLYFVLMYLPQCTFKTYNLVFKFYTWCIDALQIEKCLLQFIAVLQIYWIHTMLPTEVLWSNNQAAYFRQHF